MLTGNAFPQCRPNAKPILLAKPRLAPLFSVMDKETRIKEAAKRALKEAEARKATTKPQDLPEELGGRDGPEPIRFGDWEKKGIASDF